MATDNKQGRTSPTAKDKESSKSGSILVKLLEEEQQQTKAVTVGQRGLLASFTNSVCVQACMLLTFVLPLVGIDNGNNFAKGLSY